MQKKKIHYKIIVHRKVLPCPSCIYPWSYCRLPRKVYQRVFPENGQSPVSRVSSERQGSPLIATVVTECEQTQS